MLFNQIGSSSHIVGGNLSYEITRIDLASNTFTINLRATLFRDVYQNGRADPTPIDADIIMGIFREDNTGWVYEYTELVPVLRPNNIDLTVPENPCFDIGDFTTVFVDKSNYILENITLDIIDESYRLIFQRCCRNEAITNIDNPRNTGAVFDVVITPEAQRRGNTSPIFNFDPSTVICNLFEQTIDFSATDPDDHDLEYSFCNLQSTGGLRQTGDGSGQILETDCDIVQPDPQFCGTDLFTDVQFTAPLYSFSNPLPGQEDFVIDQSTGIITGISNVTGVYLFGVCVSEFATDPVLGRYKIGEVRRDFQVNVINCEPIQAAPFPESGLTMEEQVTVRDQCRDFGSPTTISNACSANVQLSNYTDADPETTSFEWVIDLGPGNDLVNTTDWEPLVNFPDVGTYDVFLTINKGEICETSCRTQVNVTELFTADFEAVVPPDCTEGPIVVTNNSIIPAGFNYRWDFGDGNLLENADPTEITYADAGEYTIRLFVEDAQQSCTAMDSAVVSYNPLPDLVNVIPSNTIGCDTTNVRFDNLSIPENNPYTLEWDFGDGQSSSELNPEHSYTSPGSYNVSLRVESSADCSMDFDFTDWSIEILPAPEASFSFSPNPVTNPNQSVSFDNTSEGAGGGFEWDFGDRSVGSTDENPSHRYSDAGNYEVELIAISNINMCSDTAYAIVPVSAIGDPIFPNAFRPIDGFNNEFRAVSVFDTFNSYECAVYDRWGQQVFLSNELDEGWNGKMNNNGAHLPMGVYIWNVKYEVFVGLEIESRSKKGTVLLIR